MTLETEIDPTAVTAVVTEPEVREAPIDRALLNALPPPPGSPKEAPLKRLRKLGSGGNGPKGPTRPDGEEGGSFDLRNTWQVAVGSILIPLGFVVIVIGWYGAAHASVVQQQIPYLVSGPFIGLGMTVVGGFLFFSHWLYRIYDQADIHHEEDMKVLEQIALSLSSLRGAGPVAAVTEDNPPGAPVSGTSDAVTYYATASGTVYHQAGCAVIAHNPEDLRVLRPGGLDGLRPCQICTPG
ncbi:MAG TPA: hypothetical protein VND70_10415 [Acidimicrobiales bacterium]|nr:hypothetical protein [Acidimicrobiales bacterium]